MPATDCRYFSGYKPCGKIDSQKESCSQSCSHFERPRHRILLIHLGALGAVVRSTALLPAILRKYPGAHITWITDSLAQALLEAHPLIDRTLVSDQEGLLSLRALHFDVAFVVDKSLKAAGILKSTEAKSVFGFTVEAATGAILPATPAARELWEIGLSDHLKFNVNRKPETQLITEALELGPWMRDRYHLELSPAERVETARRQIQWSDAGRRIVIGFNTGCANVIAYKKLTVEGHVEVLKELVGGGHRVFGAPGPAPGAEFEFVLLGGREDTLRNQAIAARARLVGISVIESSTDRGLRDGMISVSACDVVVTGDSLGMHMALGLERRVVAWFGPTCAHEVDLYGGEAIQSKAPCAPCWKRSCEKQTMCYDQVDFHAVANAVRSQAALLDRRSPDTPLEINAEM